jgi:hypothetical protein
MKVGADLAITIASHPYNFLTLAHALDKINLLYRATATTQGTQQHATARNSTTKTGNLAGAGIRVYGIRRISPFKAFNPAHLMGVQQSPCLT